MSVLDDDDQPELPEHTESMRRAAHYCLDSLLSLTETTTSNRERILKLTCTTDQTFRFLRRINADEEFWNTSENRVIPILSYSNFESPRAFREHFHDLNLPCLIDFHSAVTNRCDDPTSKWFGFLDEQWKLLEETDNQREIINRNWFIHTLGAETKVPVRFQPLEARALDEEGRASECKSKDVSVTEWIQMLNDPTSTSSDGDRYSIYLKDWHLLKQLQEQKKQDHKHPLYVCPPIFEFDLLNSFLTRFTKGDYRFCYWGPRGSFTSRHSDVLHSFSWSYNVVGTKLWTFFRNNNNRNLEESHTDSNPQNDGCDKIEVIQRTGQAMFVPSQWQHEVVNLEETISINHNWLTTANVDQCWECLTTEMRDVDNELRQWNIHDNLEAQESMLRGCVGLDVTAFFLMCVVRLCDLLSTFTSIKQDANSSDACQEMLNDSEREQDVARLIQMTRVVRQNEKVKLQGRLESVLQSRDLSTDLVSAIDTLVHQYNPDDTTILLE